MKLTMEERKRLLPFIVFCMAREHMKDEVRVSTTYIPGVTQVPNSLTLGDFRQLRRMIEEAPPYEDES